MSQQYIWVEFMTWSLWYHVEEWRRDIDIREADKHHTNKTSWRGMEHSFNPSRGRGRQISVNCRLAWPTMWVPGKPGLLYGDPVSESVRWATMEVIYDKAFSVHTTNSLNLSFTNRVKEKEFVVIVKQQRRRKKVKWVGKWLSSQTILFCCFIRKDHSWARHGGTHL